MTSKAQARSGWRYRSNVGLRTLAGTLGAYAVAAIAGMALARMLPMSRVEATIFATLAACLIAPGVTIWAFLARTPWRALASIVGAAAMFALIAWCAGAPTA